MHYINIILIILIIGGFAGLTNFLNHYFDDDIKKFEVLRYIASGVGAAILVPFLLSLLSSNLIKDAPAFDILNYFVFAGLCFVAGYYSDRFIALIGNNIMNDLAKTKREISKVSKSTEENKKTIDLIVSTKADIDETEEQPEIDIKDIKGQLQLDDDTIKNQINSIIKSFNGETKFRTTKSISKELDYDENITKKILEALQRKRVIEKLISGDGRVLWGLTSLGYFVARKK